MSIKSIPSIFSPLEKRGDNADISFFRGKEYQWIKSDGSLSDKSALYKFLSKIPLIGSLFRQLAHWWNEIDNEKLKGKIGTLSKPFNPVVLKVVEQLQLEVEEESEKVDGNFPSFEILKYLIFSKQNNEILNQHNEISKQTAYQTLRLQKDEVVITPLTSCQKGIPNGGNRCYLNSALQVMVADPELLKALNEANEDFFLEKLHNLNDKINEYKVEKEDLQANRAMELYVQLQENLNKEGFIEAREALSRFLTGFNSIHHPVANPLKEYEKTVREMCFIKAVRQVIHAYQKEGENPLELLENNKTAEFIYNDLFRDQEIGEQQDTTEALGVIYNAVGYKTFPAVKEFNLEKGFTLSEGEPTKENVAFCEELNIKEKFSKEEIPASFMNIVEDGNIIVFQNSLANAFAAEHIESVYRENGSTWKAEKLIQTKLKKAPNYLSVALPIITQDSLFPRKVEAPSNMKVSLPAANIENQEEDVEYQIVAFTCKSGTAFFGHYKAYRKDGDQWFEFNDSDVVPITDEEIGKKFQEAYFVTLKKEAVISSSTTSSSQNVGESETKTEIETDS